MSNFYDLETDLAVDEVQPEEQEFEDISEFAAFDPQSADSRWGKLDFVELIGELENYIATSKRFFFSRKKRVINGEEVTHLMQYIQNKLPGELTSSRKIIAEEESIISAARQQEKEIVDSAQNYYKTTTQSATEDADKIIKRAQDQAEEMVAAHAITQAARVRADEIRDNCQKEMNALVAQTFEDCEAHKQQAREWAAATAQGSYNFICDALSKYQNIAMNNLNQITDVYKQFQSGYESHMQSLQADAKVQPQRAAAAPAEEDDE